MRLIYPAIAAGTALWLASCGGGGVGPKSTQTALSPTASISASPTTIDNGQSSTLTWSSTNATACTAAGGWSGTLATSGTQSTGALTADTTFSLTCTGPGGTTAATPVTVTVTPPPLPTATLSANPTVVAPSGTSTLSWSSGNATSCTASGGWSGTLPTSGSQSTGAVTTNTTYSLTCSGAGGISTAASATVTVSGTTMSLSPKIAALTVSQSWQYTATVPGGGAATWKVDGVAGGNATVGLISATGVYTAGTAVGTHNILATSNANTTQSAGAIAAVTDLAGMLTYHNNLSRNGANSQEYALTPGNVNTAGFGKLTSCPVDGAIYTQPLWVANLTVNGAQHNVVFVATQHDGLFAFDADASPCVMLWSANLIDVAHGASVGETPVPSNLIGSVFGDIQPEVGVTGTPVIDPAAGILYVVSKSYNQAQMTFYQRLHAIDLSSGTEKTGAPALISGTVKGTGDGGSTVNFNPQPENQRAGLALVNGVVYIAWAAHEDMAPWYGWMMGYQYGGSGFTQTAILNAAPNFQGAGIWMSGGAPAVDSNNRMYVLTGNGTFDAANTSAPNNDYGDSLLQLDATLKVQQSFTPSNQLTQLQLDQDFGSGGAAMLADLPASNTVTHALICGGKDNGMFVLNRDMLGGFGDSAAVQPLNLGHPVYATGAFSNNEYYLAGAGGPLTQFQLNTSNANFTQTTVSSHVYGFPGATPSISSAATQSGVVWALDTNSYCTQESLNCGPAVLYAYDAANVATELWNSSQNAGDAAGYAVKFAVPTVANGKVYVGTRGNNVGLAETSTSTPGELDIYGLKP